MELPINQRTQRVLSKIPFYFGCDVAPEKYTLSAVNRPLSSTLRSYSSMNFGHKVRDCVPPGKLARASDPRWHANSSLSVSQTSRHYEY